MYATTKNSKLYSRLEIETASVAEPKLKAISSIEGRVVALCLTTWYFGYTFTEMSPPQSYSSSTASVRQLYGLGKRKRAVLRLDTLRSRSWRGPSQPRHR